MSLWARVGVLGTLAYYMHGRRRALAESSGKFRQHAGKDQLELKLVLVLFRHGARTPLRAIPDVDQVSPGCWDGIKPACALQSGASAAAQVRKRQPLHHRAAAMTHRGPPHFNLKTIRVGALLKSVPPPPGNPSSLSAALVPHYNRQ